MGTNDTDVATGTEVDTIEEFVQGDSVPNIERTKQTYRRALNRFKKYISDPKRNGTGSHLELHEATPSVCERWPKALESESLKPRAISTYLYSVHKFYSDKAQRGLFNSNPMRDVIADFDREFSPAGRRDMAMTTVRDLVDSVRHPRDRALFLMLLKTGMNVGELCNLDFRDLTMTDVMAQPAFSTEERPELDGYADAIYLDPNVDQNIETNGEMREESNRRGYPTIIPIDKELRQVLQQWLLIRPTAPSDADPLFVSVSNKWGERITAKMVRNIVEREAKNHSDDLYTVGGGVEKNITPSYFRNFLFRYLRKEGVDLGILMYLKGIKFRNEIRSFGAEPDYYARDWETNVRDVYEQNVYSITAPLAEEH